jgi:hypothetical protein
VQATSFAGRGAAGKTSATKNFTLTVRNTVANPPMTDAPVMTALRLIDPRTGETIPGYEAMTESTTIRLSTLASRVVSLVAVTNVTGSVEVIGFGKTEVLDARPFQTGSFYATRGKFYVQATAYTVDGAAGAASAPLGLTIRFV